MNKGIFSLIEEFTALVDSMLVWILRSKLAKRVMRSRTSAYGSNDVVIVLVIVLGVSRRGGGVVCVGSQYRTSHVHVSLARIFLLRDDSRGLFSNAECVVVAKLAFLVKNGIQISFIYYLLQYRIS